MKHTDPAVFPRLAEEIFRTGLGNTELAKLLGCNLNTIAYWLAGGGTPQAYYLAKMHKIGLDVIYILTGERTRNDRTRSKDNH
jgi:transcriptional regulator with XRE-family HTH domain